MGLSQNKYSTENNKVS